MSEETIKLLKEAEFLNKKIKFQFSNLLVKKIKLCTEKSNLSKNKTPENLSKLDFINNHINEIEDELKLLEDLL